MPVSRVSPSRQNSLSVSTPITASPSKPPKKNAHHPSFDPLLEFLGHPLEPIVGCTSGLIPVDFPSSILSYQLLTHEQLDNLACFFQQTSPPTQETLSYPAPIEKPWIGKSAERGVSLDTKRRRFGHFIGLQGCDSPTVEAHRVFEEPMLVDIPPLSVDLDDAALSDMLAEIAADSEAFLEERMEAEWQAALAEAQAPERNPYGWK